MTQFSEKIIQKAQSMQRSLVLPESSDERVLKAAALLQEKNIVSHICLIGNKDTISKTVDSYSIHLNEHKTEIIDSETDTRLEDYAHFFYEKRKHKNVDEETAYATMKNPLYFATALVAKEEYHAMIAGAITSTADVLRAALQVIGVASGLKLISSAFIIEHPNTHLGEQGCLVFSDCAIIPHPNSEELVQIALAAIDTCRVYLEAEAKIAFLSFSTKGSAKHPEVDVVQKAATEMQKNHPALLIDGELQMDAALRPEVAQLKAPHSSVAGKANTLIFPNLASANISYKSTQIFGSASAYGPIIQGLAAPVSDLSRGCTTDEIVISSAMTLIQERKT